MRGSHHGLVAKAADSREAGYIHANRQVSEASLRLQKRSGPYISRGDVLQHQLLQAQLTYQTLQLRVLLLQFLQPPAPGPPATRRTPCANGSTSARLIPPSRQATDVVFPFATATSICRNKLTICSAVCFFPFAILRSSHTSLSHLRRHKKNPALQV